MQFPTTYIWFETITGHLAIPITDYNDGSRNKDVYYTNMH
jgi:hypothetical protein